MNGAEPIVIIGGGVSGLAAQTRLAQLGRRTLLLEKSRGLGGRCSSRRWDESRADLGAQITSQGHPEWKGLAPNLFAQLKAVALPGDPIHPRYVHPEGLSKIARTFAGVADPALAGLAEQRFQAKVTRLSRAEAGDVIELQLEDGSSLRSRDVILTAPVPQALSLLHASITSSATSAALTALQRVQYHRCLTFVLEATSVARAIARPILKNPTTDIDGIYDQTAKGLTSATPSIVVHASPAWSEQHWDAEPAVLQSALRLALAKVPGDPSPNLSALPILHSHRWRYAEPIHVYPDPFFCFEHSSARLWLAGDGFTRGSVEGALESGLRVAERVATVTG